jgi:aspartyl protease family protein
MKAVAVVVMSVVLAGTGAPFAKAQQPMSATPPQGGNRVVLAQGQLPSIDRPTQVPSHDIASATRLHGHFFFNTEVNSVAVPMMFDTGASWVSLRAEDAARVGINVSSLNFSLHPSTANGIGSAAPVVIRELKVGNITRTNVPAVVVQPGMMAFSLLGQSFMSLMAGFTTEGDKLTLHGD